MNLPVREPERKPQEKSMLNERQEAAAAHTEGPALVLAGAGSGKTRVITGRAARLISSGLPPWAIFCVTFTNKAAQEMRDRIAESLGMDVSDMWISTFHSACLRIIKNEYQKLGFPSMPMIFDSLDQRSLVRSIVKNMGKTDADIPHRRVLSLISKYKNDLQGPEEMASDSKLYDAKTIAEIFHLYQLRLMENNAVDFDDLLLLVVKLLEKNSEALEKYRRKFKYLMVDEFQDTNLVQYKIVKLLAEQHKNIFVVGDDDQSIYRWRGARVGNLYGFEKDFPGCKVYKLEENYRSTANILKAANSVVSAIAGRKEKTLWTRRDGGSPIIIHTATDEMDEANFVVNEIAGMVSAGNVNLGDIAIFYRTNAQSRVLEERLNFRKIFYRIYGGLKFYARKEIKDILAYLRLALNERDEMSFGRAIASPPRGIGSVTLAKLKECAVRENISLFEACVSEGNGASKTASVKLAGFRSLIEELKESAPKIPAGDIIKIAIEKSGYLTALLDKKTAQDNTRAENLKELVSAPHKNEAIAGFLERTSLMSDQDNMEETSGAASLMTLHVSKGLEYPVVFMVGMEQNLFPHANSLESAEEMDEERRLCYVGMTRAKRKLYLTHAKRRMIFGKTGFSAPSVFLGDIPSNISEASFSKEELGRPANAGRKLIYNVSARQPDDIDMNPDDELRPGVAVNHKKFGRGVILKCEGIGEEMKFLVKFSFPGVKKLSSKYVTPAF